MMEWFLVFLLLCLGIGYLLLGRLSKWLWNGQPRKLHFGQHGDARYVQLELLDLRFPETRRIERLRIRLLRLQWTPPWRPLPAAGATRLTILAQDVDVSLRYDCASASGVGALSGLWLVVGIGAAPLLAAILGLLNKLRPADVVLDRFALSYLVDGCYPVTLAVERLEGEGHVALSGATSSFQRAKGSLSLDGTPLADFEAAAPSNAIRFGRKGLEGISVTTQRCSTRPRIADITRAASRPGVRTAAGVEAAAMGSAAADKEGFTSTSSGFSFSYDSTALIAAATGVSVAYGSFRPASIVSNSPPLSLSSSVTAKDVFTSAIAARSKAGDSASGTITPLHASRVGVRLLYDAATAPSIASSAQPQPRPETDSQQAGGEDGGSSGAAADIGGSSKNVVAAQPAASVTAGDMAAAAADSAKSTATTTGGAVANNTSVAAASSDSGSKPASDDQGGGGSGGDSNSSSSASGRAVVLEAEDVNIAVRQGDPAFKRMPAAAERLDSDLKALAARAAARTEEASPLKGNGDQPPASQSPSTPLIARIDRVSLQVDGSTAKIGSVTASAAGGVHAADVDVTVVLLQLVPVVACRMAALTYHKEGSMGIEGLQLDAGRLGPVTLFDMAAQGVGYTAANQEVVLAKWWTKLAGIRTGGGERWAGILEAADTGDGRDFRVVRRIIVPPGVAIHQVYRSTSKAAEPDAQKAAENYGLIRIRPFDAEALKSSPPPAGGWKEGKPLPGAPPPAGFGLDLLPGFKHGLRYDFAVQPMVLPRVPETSLGSLLQAVLRR